MSPVAYKTLEHSKLACKKLAEFFSFLPWVNYLRGDLCLQEEIAQKHGMQFAENSISHYDL